MEEFLNKHHIKEQVIAVGVSGGADSLALVIMASEQLKLFGRKIVAITVDHKLRPSSTQEALYVAQVMQKHNIEHHILTWDGEKPTTGLEEAARTARYNLISQWCKQNNIKILMTAHHLYDQIETFLMRLQRGSGLDGLSCMREISDFDGLTILRPLLHTDNKELKNFLRQRNIEWVHDESNDDENFLRVKMRKFIPELIKKTSISPSRFDEAITNLQSAENFIEQEIMKTFNTSVKNDFDTVYSFKYSEYLQWHFEQKFRILNQLCRKQYTPRADSVINLIEALNKLPFPGLTLGGKEIFSAYKRVWIVPELSSKHQNTRTPWKDFILTHSEYTNRKIPHKAKLAILEKVNYGI